MLIEELRQVFCNTLTRLTTSKCDGGRPACKGCSTRKLDCHYDHEPGEGRLQVLKRKFDALEAQSASAFELLENLRTAPYGDAMQLFTQLRSQTVPFTPQTSRAFQGAATTTITQDAGPPRSSSGIEAQHTSEQVDAPAEGNDATTVYLNPYGITEGSPWTMAIDPYAY